MTRLGCPVGRLQGLREGHGSVYGQRGQTPEILGGGRQRVMAAGLGGRRKL